MLRRTLVLPLALALLPTTGQAQDASPLAPAAWLSGCWELRSGPRVTLEMWMPAAGDMMPAAGDMMLGASRTQVEGVTREYEQLRLSVADGALVYTASPSRQSPTAFTSVHASDRALVFENLEHDFPQRILYRPQGPDSLVACIEGPGRNGPRGFDFPMARVACSG